MKDKMDYLKKYDITQEQIRSLKDRYSTEIIDFFEKNSDFIEEKLKLLQNEKFVLLYDMLYNNIKIFLEELFSLKEKIEIMKKQNISLKAMNMILIEEELYDKI